MFRTLELRSECACAQEVRKTVEEVAGLQKDSDNECS